METQTIIDIKHLRDIEQNILTTMVHDEEKFLMLEKKYSKEYFTFTIHKFIFEEICLFKDKIFEVIKLNDIDLYVELIQNIAESLDIKDNLNPFTTYDILTKTPKDTLAVDMVELDHYIDAKNLALKSHTKECSTLEIVLYDKYGITTAVYKQARLMELVTTNIFRLANDIICDTDGITFDKLNEIGFIGDNTSWIDEEELLYGKTKTIHFKKGLRDFKDLEFLGKWVNKYDIGYKDIPLNKKLLFEKIDIDISNKGIKELPKELRVLDICSIEANNNLIEVIPAELYNLDLLSLFLINNNLNYISSKIENLKKLFMLGLCQNDISDLPESIYNLERLQILCLHDNNLTNISHKISNMKNLRTLTISNNDIKYLPNTIGKLHLLESLDIENNLIDEIPIEILSLVNLKHITFDDKHLLSLINNFHLFKHMDSINLFHSEYSIEDDLFKDLDLKVIDESWMEDRDYRGHGCVILKNFEYEK